MDKIPEMTQLSPSWTREDSEDTGPLEDGLVHKTESTPFVSALTDPVLKTINLSVGFGKADILHGVSVEIARGETTALIGPTGSGKSTFLRALNRMNDRVTGYRHDGDVLLDGESIFRPSLDMLNLRRKVGMLFQRPNPFPMSIRDNVVAGVKAHRMAKRSQFTTFAEERLTQVGLFDAVKDRMNRSPFELSGGQQQLLCLARALAVEPEVLLLDEPTSSLDPVTTERVESLIKNLTPHISVIIVTHNLGQARRVSDRTMLFFDGRLAEFATTEQLFEHPVNETTANYVSGRIG